MPEEFITEFTDANGVVHATTAPATITAEVVFTTTVSPIAASSRYYNPNSAPVPHQVPAEFRPCYPATKDGISILSKYLTVAQKADLEENKGFNVRSSNGVLFRIWSPEKIHPTRVEPNNVWVRLSDVHRDSTIAKKWPDTFLYLSRNVDYALALCTYADVEDAGTFMLAQKLLLEANEDEFGRHACATMQDTVPPLSDYDGEI